MAAALVHYRLRLGWASRLLDPEVGAQSRDTFRSRRSTASFGKLAGDPTVVSGVSWGRVDHSATEERGRRSPMNGRKEGQR